MAQQFFLLIICIIAVPLYHYTVILWCRHRYKYLTVSPYSCVFWLSSGLDLLLPFSSVRRPWCALGPSLPLPLLLHSGGGCATTVHRRHKCSPGVRRPCDDALPAEHVPSPGVSLVVLALWAIGLYAGILFASPPRHTRGPGGTAHLIVGGGAGISGLLRDLRFIISHDRWTGLSSQ